MTRFTPYADNDEIGGLLVDTATVHVERLLPTVSDTWELLVSCPELWLGDAVRIEQTGRYAVDGCLDSEHAHGRIEEVAMLERIVLTWQPDSWDAPALVEIAGVEAGDSRTRVSAHVEDVPEQVGRAHVAAHWQAALDRLAAPAVTSAETSESRAGSASHAAQPQGLSTPLSSAASSAASSRRHACVSSTSRPASRHGSVTFFGSGRKPTTSITHQYAAGVSARPLVSR